MTRGSASLGRRAEAVDRGAVVAQVVAICAGVDVTALDQQDPGPGLGEHAGHDSTAGTRAEHDDVVAVLQRPEGHRSQLRLRPGRRGRHGAVAEHLATCAGGVAVVGARRRGDQHVALDRGRPGDEPVQRIRR